ncbi:MAG: hypothetical protein JW741_04735 [Sedimentisphaerales bacterium]|nr:hypothetical protein [Sedimentisphaerales bacterium]
MLGMDAVRQTQSDRAKLRSALYRTVIGLLLATGLLCATAAGETAPEADWDSQRYIKIDEIARGMEAYCLTDYGDAGIERFELKVVDVVRGYEPGHDIILVMGLDERFKHTGPVSGCSGSPVYIGERLAGALARSWYWAEDPLYGVTPIAEMLQVGAGSAAKPARGTGRDVALRLDFSKPINLTEVDEQVRTMGLSKTDTTGGPTALPCPLLVSGVSAATCRQLASELGEMGFAAVPGLSGEPESGNDDDTDTLQPGGVLTIPLIAGDIRATALGTVTEVRDDKVYGFGHDYLGYGAVNLPLTAGKIYTVVSSPMQSFKLGAAGKIIGAITADESTAIFGRIGAKPKMVPLTIRVERYNDPEVRTYNCQVAYNRMLTPGLVRSALAAAALQRGGLPPDHTIEYKAAVDMDDGNAIRFENVSAGFSTAELVVEVGGTLGLLMNHPYQGADVKSLDFELRILPKDLSAHLWSVDITDTKVKRGQNIEIEVITESFFMEKKKYRVSLNVPKDVAPGKYSLMLLGIYEYESFLRKALPYRLVAMNYQTLIEALNESLGYNRTKLYCLLVLRADGIALDRAELPDLPATKSLVLQSNKRDVRVQPYPHWIEKTVETGTVIADKVVVPVVVER